MRLKHLIPLLFLLIGLYSCEDDSKIKAPDSNEVTGESTTIFLGSYPDYLEGKTLWVLLKNDGELIRQYKHILEKDTKINVPLEDEECLIYVFVPKDEKWLPWEKINSTLGYGSKGTFSTTAQERTITDWTNPNANYYNEVLSLTTPEIETINSFVKTDLLRFKLDFTSNISETVISTKVIIDGNTIEHSTFYNKGFATLLIPTENMDAGVDHKMMIEISNDKGYSKSIEEDLTFSLIELENTLSINLKNFPSEKSSYVLVETVDGKNYHKFIFKADANSTIKVPCDSKIITCSINVIENLEYTCNLSTEPIFTANGNNMSIDENYTIANWEDKNTSLVPRLYGSINEFENFNSLIKGDLLKLIPDYEANLDNSSIKNKVFFIDDETVEFYQPNAESNATFIETNKLKKGPHKLKLEITDNLGNKAIDEVTFNLKELEKTCTVSLNNFPVEKSKFVIVRTNENQIYTFKAEERSKIEIPCNSNLSEVSLYINENFDTNPEENSLNEVVYIAKGYNLNTTEEYTINNWEDLTTTVMKANDISVSGILTDYYVGDFISGQVTMNIPFGTEPKITFSINDKVIPTMADTINEILINTIDLNEGVSEFKVLVESIGTEPFEFKKKIRISTNGTPQRYSVENSHIKLTAPYNGTIVNGALESNFSINTDISLYNLKLYIGDTEIHTFNIPEPSNSFDLTPYNANLNYGWNTIRIVGETVDLKTYTYYSNIFVKYIFFNGLTGLTDHYAIGDIISGKINVEYPEEMIPTISYKIDGTTEQSKSEVDDEILFNTLSLKEGDYKLIVEIKGDNSEVIRDTAEFSINKNTPNPNTTQNTKINLTNPKNGTTINGDLDQDLIITASTSLKSLVVYNNGVELHEFSNLQSNNTFTLNPYKEDLKAGNNELKIIGIDWDDNTYTYLSNINIKYIYLNSVSGISDSYNIGEIISGKLNLSHPEDMNISIDFKVDGLAYTNRATSNNEFLFNTIEWEEGEHEISFKVVAKNNEIIADTISINIGDEAPSSTTNQSSEIEIKNPTNGTSFSKSSNIEVIIDSNVTLSTLVVKCQGVLIENIASPVSSNTINFKPSENDLKTGWSELEAMATDEEGHKHIFISNIKITEE
ncbi:hypothetical protein [Ancylomarina euxinus]|nr:hypothetical protein [Ancylomarina euxinus]MCZ4693520.1 hypothetical protein [Ancylomarina euxinus]MUP13747.1 hypothetical protein [Ancylomarina euxinus]